MEVCIPARYIVEDDILKIPGVGLAWFIHDMFQYGNIETLIYRYVCTWYISKDKHKWCLLKI